MRIILACVLAVALATSVHAAGTVVYDVEFESAALGETRTFSIYLPEGYDADTRSYPVVYFLHGCMCGSYDPDWVYWTYNGLENYLNDNMGNGTIQPAIVVLPDGCGGPYCGSVYTDSELYGDFENYIAVDLVAFVDMTYRTIDRRNYRLIMGHSMGGYGAMKLAFKYPEVYGAAGSHAGLLEIVMDIDLCRADILAENAPGPPYTYDPGNGDLTAAMFAKSGAFSPNPDNVPEPVDFPYDENGDMIDAVAERWVAHNPPRLARELIESGGEVPCIWFDAGTLDEYYAYPEAVALAESLQALGIPYEFETHTGGHLDLRFWASFPYLLDYDADFGCAIVGIEDGGPRAKVTMRVLPNPSRSNSTFEFALTQAESVTLIVYDVGGKVVRSVFDGQLDAGSHSLTWDGKSEAGSQVADGVYFVALRTGADTEVMRTIRLK